VNGTFFGSVTASDPDGDPLVFSIVTTDGCPIRMNSSGWLFTDSALGVLDFESKATCAFTVEVTEVSTAVPPLLSSTQGVSSLTVNVRDVNEAPTFGTLPTGYSVPEESGAGVVVTPTVGTFITVADQDGGNASALTVTVASSAWGFSSNYFEVVRSSDFAACRGGDTCILRVRTGSPRMDYDAGLVRVNVTVTVADSNGLRMTTPNFTVTIVDINQGAFALRRYVAAWGCVVSRSGSGRLALIVWPWCRGVLCVLQLRPSRRIH
jgi:hypothetical protein